MIFLFLVCVFVFLLAMQDWKNLFEKSAKALFFPVNKQDFIGLGLCYMFSKPGQGT